METEEFFKFPRTPHLDDMGAASRDDLIMAKADALAMLARGVVIEEKVDGANLGISFTSLDGPPRCQKRGHWVTHKSEQQFCKLESWLAQHTDALRQALGIRYILYGEWVAARHSVPYDALPDWFLAFDVFDKQTRKFLSSRRRNELLSRSGVRSVPSVVAAPGRVFHGPDALEDVRQLVQGLRSALCVSSSEQWAEGVVVRLESDTDTDPSDSGWLVARAKLVHPAFRQAIEGTEPPPHAVAGGGGGSGGRNGTGGGGGTHWSKRTIQWNRLRPDLWPWQGPDLDSNPNRNSDSDSDPDRTTAAELPDPVLLNSMGNQARPGSRQVPVTATTAAAVAAPARAVTIAAAAVAAAEPCNLAAARLQLVGAGYYVSLIGNAVDAVATCFTSQPGLLPPGHAANRVLRDGPHHHITLVTPLEMTELREQYGMGPQEVYDIVVATAGPTGGAWVPIGLGRARAEPGDEALFVVIGWPAGRAARAALRLPRDQHFHITLGFQAQDVHGVPKGISALVGGVLDEQLMEKLSSVADSAGVGLTAADRAAVLVLQVFLELQRAVMTAATAVASSVAGSPNDAPSVGGDSVVRSTCTTAGTLTSPPTLAPHVMDSLYGLLSMALRWAGATTEVNVTHGTDPRVGSEGILKSSDVVAAAAAVVVVEKRTSTAARPEMYDNCEDEHKCRWRCFVAACAHIARARLAGWFCELDEVEENVRQAEALAARVAAAAAKLNGSGQATPSRSPGRDDVNMVLAAAACLYGKACSQKGSFAEAAEAFQRAEYLLGPYGDDVIGVRNADVPSGAAATCTNTTTVPKTRSKPPEAQPSTTSTETTDLVALLRQAVKPSLDSQALRAAAATCRRRMLAASSSSSSSSSQPPQPSQQSPQLTQPPHQRPNLTQQDWAQREKQKQQGEEAGEPEEYGKKGDEAPETQLQQDRGGSRPGAEAPGKVFLLQGGQLRNPRQRTVVPGVLISSTAPGGGCGSGGSSGGSSSRRVADVALPRNTSWVVPGVLAGGSTPKNADQITALYSLGVGLIITLTEEEPLPPDWFVAASSDGAAGSKTHPGPYGRGGGDGGDGAATALTAASRVRNIFVPVTNYEPPTVQQMDEVLAAIEDHQVTAVAAAAAAATGAPATAVVATAAAAMDVAAAAAPAVLVHCGGGKGRAGTVLACYLCKYGQAPPPLGTTAAAAAAAAAQQPEAEALPRTAADTTAAVRNVLMAPPAMSADAAVRLIRELRPGSIETEQQRRFVGQYCDMLWRRYDRANAESTAEMDVAVAAGSAAAGLPPILAATATGPTLPGEATIAAGAAGAAAPSASPHQTQQQQQQPLSHSQTRRTRAPNQATPPPHFRHLPRLVVLVGLPGSGKSTFAKALEASGRWSRICQDECGSRGAAETAFSSAMLRGPASSSTSSSDGWWKPHVVLDRCSPDMADRKEWLKLAMVGKRDKGIVAVFFDVDPAICKARVAARTDHPTIPQGRGGRVVDSFLTRLQPPSTNEGFERVYIIRDPRDAAALLTSWGAAAGGIAERQDGATGAAVQEATEGEY